MSDYCVCIIFVFFEEFFCSRKCYLVDIFVNIVGGHADA